LTVVKYSLLAAMYKSRYNNCICCWRSIILRLS